MANDPAYHQSALKFNNEMAEFAQNLASSMQNETVAGWARGTAKQHRYHAKQHRMILRKLRLEKGANAKSKEQENNVSDNNEEKNLVEGDPAPTQADDTPTADNEPDQAAAADPISEQPQSDVGEPVDAQPIDGGVTPEVSEDDANA